MHYASEAKAAEKVETAIETEPGMKKFLSKVLIGDTGKDSPPDVEAYVTKDMRESQTKNRLHDIHFTVIKRDSRQHGFRRSFHGPVGKTLNLAPGQQCQVPPLSPLYLGGEGCGKKGL